jgi:BirA family transcriptional regulator, biotin operon repressor / biotin---[acetyl-CoA-carboxylase] ligase
VPAARPQLAIKWPNDLLLAGAKFAGILTEGEGATVAVGIGVNCTSHPADTDYPATNLAAAGFGVSHEAVFSALSAKMIGRLAQWNQGEHFATIRTDWLSRAAGLGDTISVRMAERELSGRFETIDDMGQLVLVEPEGTRYAIAVGDVVKLRWPGGEG